MKLLLAALVASLAFVVQAVAEESLQEVRKAFTDRQTQISDAYKEGMDKLGAQFLIALGRAREAATKVGNLDAVRAIDAELARWKLDGDLPAEDSESAEIAKLHATLRAAKADLVLKRQRGIVAWHQEYDKRLQAMEKSLVTANKVEAAEEVRSERDSLRESLVIKEATEAVKAADEAGKTAKAGAGNKSPWKSLKKLKPQKAEGNEYFMRLLEKRTEPVKVAGIKYEPDDFLYTHASGRLEYQFDDPVSEFRGSVCLLDESTYGNVVFSVRNSEGELFKSKPITAANRKEDFALTFRPTRKLILVIDDNGDSTQDWSFWLKPEVR